MNKPDKTDVLQHIRCASASSLDRAIREKFIQINTVHTCNGCGAVPIHSGKVRGVVPDLGVSVLQMEGEPDDLCDTFQHCLSDIM